MNKIIVITASLVILSGLGGLTYYRLNNKPSQPSVTASGVVLPDIIEMQGVLDKKLTAKATRAFASKEVQAAYLHTIRSQLPDRPDSIVSYTTWLAKPDKSHYIRTGQLIKHPDGIWKMDFRDTRDLREYSLVIVTSETKDDAQPETEILIGKFK